MQNLNSSYIPKDIELEKKKQALTKILRCTKVKDYGDELMIQKISELPDITENFLISLVKNNFVRVIRLVYESPSVLSKLTEAGFETDPRTIDSTGKSAFFHAFKTEESQLVFLIYDHAANACLQTDASIRSPDEVIVENLQCLKDHLKLIEKDLESEEISEKSRCLFTDLCRFNEFQIEMCKSIIDVSDKKNYYNCTKKECEVLRKKETILTILKMYETYFYPATGESSLDKDDISRFKEFFEHKDYFDKLDFSSAVIFFDNLFLLKERLQLPNTAYLDIESTFFLYIFCRKYLEPYENQNPFYFVSRWITFQERLSLQRKICRFKKTLENTELSNDKIVDKLSEAVVRTLTNLPEIYGQFLIFRMQHYLNAANTLKNEDFTKPKAILVIERCLQIMGECCKQSDFNSVQRIISLALPKDFIKHLKQIRNRFAYELPYKHKLEQDVELFKGIRIELAKLKKLLLPIYSAHEYEMEQFLLTHFVKSISKARERKFLKKQENHLKALLPSPEVEENGVSMQTTSCQTLWDGCFECMCTYMRKKINDLNCNGNVIDESTASGYRSIVKNMISAVEEKLKSLKVPISNKGAEELDGHFWCLEQIVTYIRTDQKLAECSELTSMIKDQKSLFTKLRENSMQFQRTNKSTNTNTKGTLTSDGEIVGLPSKPEDTHDNDEKTMDVICSYLKYGVRINTGSFTFSNETNQVENEIRRDNFEDSVSQNNFDSSIPHKTIDTKEIKEALDFRENSEEPKSFMRTKEINSPFSEAVSTDSHSDLLPTNVHHDYPINEEAESLKEIINVKENSFIDEAETLLQEFKKISAILFREFQEDSDEDFHFKNIENYCWILKGHHILNWEEKNSILQSVPKRFQNVPELKIKVKGLLIGKTEFNLEIEEDLATLNLKPKDIKAIKEKLKSGIINEVEDIVDSAHDYFSDLKKKIELKEINKSECDLLCEKLKIPDDSKNTLLKFVSGQNKKVQFNQFDFLLHRIKTLKNILIDENNDIQVLWESATTQRKRMHVKEKIVQVFLSDSAIQASVETLLFDCMTILNMNELKHLWRKTSNLFNGVNLRNVLAHGHALLESLGRLLDPCDLPSELVEKMLKLISDEPVIKCIQQILDQSDESCKDFMEILEDERLKHLSEKIRECPHYYEYAPLIKMRNNRHRENVVSP